jgi:hypothetical protein
MLFGRKETHRQQMSLWVEARDHLMAKIYEHVKGAILAFCTGICLKSGDIT